MSFLRVVFYHVRGDGSHLHLQFPPSMDPGGWEGEKCVYVDRYVMDSPTSGFVSGNIRQLSRANPPKKATLGEDEMVDTLAMDDEGIASCSAFVWISSHGILAVQQRSGLPKVALERALGKCFHQRFVLSNIKDDSQWSRYDELSRLTKIAFAYQKGSPSEVSLEDLVTVDGEEYDIEMVKVEISAREGLNQSAVNQGVMGRLRASLGLSQRDGLTSLKVQGVAPQSDTERELILDMLHGKLEVVTTFANGECPRDEDYEDRLAAVVSAVNEMLPRIVRDYHD